MNEAAKLAEAIFRIRAGLNDTDADFTNADPVEDVRLLLADYDRLRSHPASPSREDVALEDVADAIDKARYAHPENPRERPRPFSDADSSDREYAFRLAKAALGSLTAEQRCACDTEHPLFKERGHHPLCPGPSEAKQEPDWWFTNEEHADGVIWQVDKTGPNTARYVTVARGCSAENAKQIVDLHNAQFATPSQPDRDGLLTFEEIERGAKAMFGFNAISQMQMPRWDAIDQGERNHWLQLAEACLRSLALTRPQCEGGS